jgi:hypothetical protein
MPFCFTRPRQDQSARPPSAPEPRFYSTDLLPAMQDLLETVLHGSVSGRSEPTLACVQAMRTDFGRPSSSMQFRTMTATFISVA